MTTLLDMEMRRASSSSRRASASFCVSLYVFLRVCIFLRFSACPCVCACFIVYRFLFTLLFRHLFFLFFFPFLSNSWFLLSSAIFLCFLPLSASSISYFFAPSSFICSFPAFKPSSLSSILHSHFFPASTHRFLLSLSPPILLSIFPYHFPFSASLFSSYLLSFPFLNFLLSSSLSSFSGFSSWFPPLSSRKEQVECLYHRLGR